ncbi:hypothetical protein [Sediminibacillus terrae]|uniref:hypothetical protein n=1 Tax=Sediminibacillus terrae TaxID=1562106 RepID=UPI000428C476|nr:hypothetical protein [Sediminibacillus terrae]
MKIPQENGLVLSEEVEAIPEENVVLAAAIRSTHQTTGEKDRRDLQAQKPGESINIHPVLLGGLAFVLPP